MFGAVPAAIYAIDAMRRMRFDALSQHDDG